MSQPEDQNPPPHRVRVDLPVAVETTYTPNYDVISVGLVDRAVRVPFVSPLGRVATRSPEDPSEPKKTAEKKEE